MNEYLLRWYGTHGEEYAIVEAETAADALVVWNTCTFGDIPGTPYSLRTHAIVLPIRRMSAVPAFSRPTAP